LRILISFDLVSEGKYFGFLHLQSTYIYVSIFQTRTDVSIRIYSFQIPHTCAFICGSVSAIISLIYRCETFLFVIILTNNEIRTKKDTLFDIDILSLVLLLNENQS